MTDKPVLPDPDIPQDPGIPGTKLPEQIPPRNKPNVDPVPDTAPPDVDDEGHMAPPGRAAGQESKERIGMHDAGEHMTLWGSPAQIQTS